MATHLHVASILEDGLQDDCERCAEHAEQPFNTLDDSNLSALIERTQAWKKNEAMPRSDTELAAMRYAERSIHESQILFRLGLT